MKRGYGKEREWGARAETEGHLRDDIETLCGENFLKYVMILIWSANNVSYGIKLSLSCHQTKLPRARLHLVELLTKEIPMEILKHPRL